MIFIYIFLFFITKLFLLKISNATDKNITRLNGYNKINEF